MMCLQKKLSYGINLLFISVLFSCNQVEDISFTMADLTMEPNMKVGKSYSAMRTIEAHLNTPILYKSPFSENEELWVHRLVAAEGDTVQFKKGVLYVNGENIDRQLNLNLKYCPTGPESKGKKEAEELANMEAYIVPAEHFYLIGDNRNFSFDSRHFGPVHQEQFVASFVDVR